jgi:hypothetical protein
MTGTIQQVIDATQGDATHEVDGEKQPVRTAPVTDPAEVIRQKRVGHCE